MMGTSERQLLPARFAWVFKWLLSHIRGGGRSTVEVVCPPVITNKECRKIKLRRRNMEKNHAKKRKKTNKTKNTDKITENKKMLFYVF